MRLHERLAASLECEVFDEEHEVRPARMKDLSFGGLSLEVLHWPIGDSFTLRVSVLGEPHDFPVKVRHVSDALDCLVVHGMFEPLDLRGQQILTQLLSSLENNAPNGNGRIPAVVTPEPHRK